MAFNKGIKRGAQRVGGPLKRTVLRLSSEKAEEYSEEDPKRKP